jgi:site-specific recombinase XerD
VVDRRTDEIDLDTRRISLVGKVRKPRVVPVPHVLETMLRENLDEMRPKLPVSSYLFANPRGNANLRGRYGPRALHNLVVEAGTSAGVARRHQPPTAGVIPMQLASFAGARTSTSSSA